MPRYYKVNYGRKTVRPFKLEDAKNIMIMLQKKRDATDNDRLKKIYDRDWLMFKLGLNTAFRIEDLLQIKVDDLLLKGTMYTRENKTKKEQNWELNQKLHKEVLDYIERNNLYEGEYLLKSNVSVNKPMTRQNARLRIKKYADEILKITKGKLEV